MKTTQTQLQPLALTPTKAGILIGQAEQTTRNQLYNPKIAGEFPLPLVQIGRRKMVRYKDIQDFLENLEPIKKPGRPTKVSRIGGGK